MSTIRDRLMQAAIDKLNDSAKPDNVPTSQRVRAFGASEPELPMIVVYPLKEEVERQNRTNPIVKRHFMFRVDCRAAVQVEDEITVDKAVDDMLAWVTKQLSGERFGGLAHTVNEVSSEWSIEAADYAYCSATIDFVAEYQTLASDQTRNV